MKMIKLIGVMRMMGLLNPAALGRLAMAIRRYGVNLLALLRFTADAYGERTALVDEHGDYTYRQLYVQAAGLASALRERYQLGLGKKVGVLCKSHASLVKTIFAGTSTGADLYLLNTELSAVQLRDIVMQLELELIISDERYKAKLEQAGVDGVQLLISHDVSSVAELGALMSRHAPRAASGKLVLSTGGTTGRPKQAAHRPSLFRYLDPFADFVRRLRLISVKTAYIATPLYHGYGLAVMILSLALGKKLVLQESFDAQKACQLVREHQVDMITVVPLMLHRMLRESPEDLKSLVCIACGGAELSPKLVMETLSRLGDVLYNLYGTSEAGLNFIATPQDLRADPRTVGKPLRGVEVRILDKQGGLVPLGEIGRIYVRNAWSMDGREGAWIDTGDLGVADANGYYYLCGRADSMIVSGGENVYPLEVEQIVLTHPQVEDAAAVAVSDEQFGQRLKMYVVLGGGVAASLTEDELRDWLRERLARYQMPREIEFVDRLPYTSLGKLDRKQLQAWND